MSLTGSVVGIASVSVVTSIQVGVSTAGRGLGSAERGLRFECEDFWDLLYQMKLQGLLSHGSGAPLPRSRGRVALALLVLSGRFRVVAIGPGLSLGGKTGGVTAGAASSSSTVFVLAMVSATVAA